MSESPVQGTKAGPLAMDQVPPPPLPDEPDVTIDPAGLLWESIVDFLAPMFVSAGSDALGHARLVAMEAIASYGPRTQAELMHVAQMIGFSLAAMDNLRLSMDVDMPLAIKLRLRAGAGALNRAFHQHLRALGRPASAIQRPDQVMDTPSAPIQWPDETTSHEGGVSGPQQATTPVGGEPPGIPPLRGPEYPQAADGPEHRDAPPQSSLPSPHVAAPRYPQPAAGKFAAADRTNLMWASAMTQVATDLAAKQGMPRSLPPASDPAPGRSRTT